MRDFSQEELMNMVCICRNNPSLSTSKYNSTLFIGKVIKEIEILAFHPSNKNLGLKYPVFICKCFCGRLFLRECRHIAKSQNISCGHCNDVVKNIIMNYDKYTNIPQDIINLLLDAPIYIVDKSKYSHIKKGTKIENIEILRYLPSLKEEWPPLFICRCLYCNKLFLAGTQKVMNGMYKTCGSKGCRTYLYPKNEEKITKEGYKKITIEKISKEKNKFLLLKELKGSKTNFLRCQCKECGFLIDISKEQWLNPSENIICSNCIETSKIEEKLLEKGVNYNFFTHNLQDYEKYKYLLYDSKKYLYMGKGRISKGIQYIWLRCRECGGIIEVDGEKYLKGEIFESCYCYNPYPVTDSKPVDFFKVIPWYIKYSEDKVGQNILGDILVSKGSKPNKVVVKCEDCGTLREVSEEEFFNERTYNYNICHCKEPISFKYTAGNKFGHLKLIDVLEKEYKFECDCGNTVNYEKTYFKNHVINSCGTTCKLTKFSSMLSGFENKNRIFNTLKVVNLLQRVTFFDEKMRQGVYWSCECLKCGNVFTYYALDLEKENIRQCYCETNKYLYGYHIGQKVNDVLLLDIIAIPKKGTIWQCECPYCGDMFVRDPYSIVSEHCCSCGCKSISNGEKVTFLYLSELKKDIPTLQINREYSFQDLVYKGKLRFDFRVENNNKVVLIEYDGEQHKKAKIPHVRDKEKAEQIFKEIKIRDALKDEYAKKHNIPLLRLDYFLSSDAVKKNIYTFLKEEGVI